jgi:hypothetical protein
MDVVKDREHIMKKAVENKELELLEKKAESTQAITVQAVKKEIFLENLLVNEEKEKEQIEDQEIVQQIQIEKKKNNCLLKIIKEKEIEDQFNLAKSQTQNHLNELKEEAKREIEIKRSNLKSRILKMKKKNERKKNLLKQELMNVRTEIASNINKVTRAGSKENCFSKKSDQKLIDAYCENNFFDNYYKMTDCKDIQNFCYVCCENEFGEIQIGAREECYNGCDKKEDKKIPIDGRWVWAP